MDKKNEVGGKDEVEVNFFFCMRDYEEYITSWWTLSHSFLRHSLL